MNKAIFTLLMLHLIAVSASGQSEIQLIKPDLLVKISPGQEFGQLGFRRMMGGGAGDIEPSLPAFRGDEIFIFDNQNWRINCYDLSMKYKRTINIRGPVRTIPFQSSLLYIFDNGEFSASHDVLLRIGTSGEIVFSIPSEQLPQDLSSQAKYWIYKSFTVFYLADGNLAAIDNAGNFLRPEELSLLSQSMKENCSIRKESVEMRDAIDQFLKSNRLEIIGDRLMTKRSKDYFEYYRIIRSKRQSPKNNILDEKMPEDSGALYGFDVDDNAYWRFSIKSKKGEELVVLVVSKYGEVLAKFRIDGKGSRVVSPDGDIYLCDTEWIKMGSPVFNYYRVKRKW